MIVLDLFCGSGSWGRAFAELGWEVYSIDSDPKWPATETADVHEWTPPARLHGTVAVVCVGVPCTHYSTANKQKTEEKFETTRALWRRAFAIADLVMRPGGVLLCENPSRTELTGCKSQPIGDMQRMAPHLLSWEVTYCTYSTEQDMYSWKLTTLWSNVDLPQFGFVPRRCRPGQRCDVGAMDERTKYYKHFARMAFCPEVRNQSMQRSAVNWSSVPHDLCCDVRDACIQALGRLRA
jgi:hypothetical protein